jgi:thioredoxin-dependent peroxiredoxin
MKLKYFFYSFLFLFSKIAIPSLNLINNPAPHFTAQAVFHDGSEQLFDLKKYHGKKVVLYFYPMDNTPGCTCQAKNFRDNIATLEKHGIILIGISRDSIKSHKRFQKKHELPYILISDSRSSRRIAKMYGVDSFFMSKRKTFLIDENGKIFKKFDKINIEKQFDEIIDAFEQHQN